MEGEVIQREDSDGNGEDRTWNLVVRQSAVYVKQRYLSTILHGLISRKTILGTPKFILAPS